jgi:hypothetical protein
MHWSIQLTLITAVSAVRTLQASDNHLPAVGDAKLPTPLSVGTATTTTSETGVLTGIGIVAALIGFAVAFFVGYYVGSVTSRRQVASNRAPVRLSGAPAASYNNNNTTGDNNFARTQASFQRSAYSPSAQRYPLPGANPRATNFQASAGVHGSGSSILDNFRIKK